MTPDWVRNAKVGDKVVCVKLPTITTPKNLEQVLEVGKVYEIESVNKNSWANCGIELQLAGVSHEGYFSSYFCALLFKPLQTRKTDISEFKKLLKPSKVNA